MASIVKTTTKSSSDPWLNNGKDNGVYTDIDYTQNILPYWNFIESTSGFQELVFNVNGDTKTYTITYDTPENANVAFLQFYGSNAVPVCVNYRLAADKMGKELNVNYTFNTVINY